MCAASVVRRARPDDTAVLLRLLEQLGYRESDPSLVRRLLEDGAHAVFVAEDDGRVVGYLNANSRFQLHHGREVVTIDELVVDEGSRDGGIGAALVGAVLEWGRERGADTVEVTSNVRRERAIAFYRRCGFQPTSSKLVYQLR